ncbi:unnamed protein product [Cladocopium goreaui]|uniref:GST N-terminal domain-containing protein n=1 Tax=Cladocopium goreaui TaxID=2562237 RepID=A0A9P1DW17_9DINO|nr:unnamed protein product [Cladocopium goreaui]
MALKSGVFACLILALCVSCNNVMAEENSGKETEKSGIIIGRGLPSETEKSGAPFLPRSENLEETEKSGIIIGRGLPSETEKSGAPFLPRSENLEETEKSGIIIPRPPKSPFLPRSENLEETEKSGLIIIRGLPSETEKSGAPFLPRSENLEETEKSGIIIGRGLPSETEKSGAPFLPRSENLEETEKSGDIIIRGLPSETEKSGAPFLPRSENLEETEKSGIIIGRGLPSETEKSGAPFLPRSENLEETEKSGIIIGRGLPSETEKSGAPFLPRSENLEETEKSGIIIGRGLPSETEKSGAPFLPRSENLEETEKSGIIIGRGLPSETEKSGAPFLPRSENLEETEKSGIIIGRGLPSETEKSGAPFLPRSENLEETEKSGDIIIRGLPSETEKSGAPFLPRSENLEETEKSGIIIGRGLPSETEKSGAPFLPRSENLEETEKSGIIIGRGLPSETEKSGAPFLPRSENLEETEKSGIIIGRGLPSETEKSGAPFLPRSENLEETEKSGIIIGRGLPSETEKSGAPFLPRSENLEETEKSGDIIGRGLPSETEKSGAPFLPRSENLEETEKSGIIIGRGLPSETEKSGAPFLPRSENLEETEKSGIIIGRGLPSETEKSGAPFLPRSENLEETESYRMFILSADFEDELDKDGQSFHWTLELQPQLLDHGCHLSGLRVASQLPEAGGCLKCLECCDDPNQGVTLLRIGRQASQPESNEMLFVGHEVEAVSIAANLPNETRQPQEPLRPRQRPPFPGVPVDPASGWAMMGPPHHDILQVRRLARVPPAQLKISGVDGWLHNLFAFWVDDLKKDSRFSDGSKKYGKTFEVQLILVLLPLKLHVLNRFCLALWACEVTEKRQFLRTHEQIPMQFVAVEASPEISAQYALTHRAHLIAASDRLPDDLFLNDLDWIVQADVFNLNLRKAVHTWMPTIICISSPCPPWSTAAASAGLHSKEGLLLAQSILEARFARPAFLLIEQVAGFAFHQHKPLIEQLLLYCGFQLIFQKTLDLKDVSQPARLRWLGIARRVHASVMKPNIQAWPRKHASTFPNPQLHLPESLRHQTIVTAQMEEVASSLEYAKHKTKGTPAQILQAKIFQPTEHLPTFMARYGTQHLLEKSLLKEKGYFGHFVHDSAAPKGFRLWHPSEVVLAHGLADVMHIPNDFILANKIVGNMIAVQHALPSAPPPSSQLTDAEVDIEDTLPDTLIWQPLIRGEVQMEELNLISVEPKVALLKQHQISSVASTLYDQFGQIAVFQTASFDAVLTDRCEEPDAPEVLLKWDSRPLWRGALHPSHDIRTIAMILCHALFPISKGKVYRIVSKGKQQAPETTMECLRSTNQQPAPIVLFAVMEMHGGGAKQQQKAIQQNALATAFLEQGHPLDWTAKTVDSIVDKVSLHRLQSITSQPKKSTRIQSLMQLCEELKIQIPEPPKPQSRAVPATVCQLTAITIYKEDWPDHTWMEAVHSTSAFIRKVLQTDQLDKSLQAIWGRSLRNGRSPASPNEAISIQVHATIDSASFGKLLQKSGFNKLYLTPKQQTGRPTSEYRIIWLHGECSVPKAIAISAQTSGCAGLVKGKNGALGLRYPQPAFDAAWQVINPKIAPPTDFQGLLMFNTSPLLIRLIQSRDAKKTRLVLGPRQNPTYQSGPEADPWAQADPWSNWKPARPALQATAPVARNLEGPIEAKFDSQEQKISAIRTELDELAQKHEKHAKAVQEEFAIAKQREAEEFSKVHYGMKKIQSDLDNNLANTMKQHSQAMEQQFRDLKALFQQSQKRSKPDAGDDPMEFCNLITHPFVRQGLEKQPILALHSLKRLGCTGHHQYQRIDTDLTETKASVEKQPVHPEPWFDAHKVVIITLQMPREPFTYLRLTLPHSFMHLPLNEDHLPDLNLWVQAIRTLNPNSARGTTRGFPEGDPMSVMTMISIATAWTYMITDRTPAAQMAAYADNWGWYATFAVVIDIASHDSERIAAAKQFAQSSLMPPTLHTLSVGRTPGREGRHILVPFANEAALVAYQGKMSELAQTFSILCKQISDLQDKEFLPPIEKGLVRSKRLMGRNGRGFTLVRIISVLFTNMASIRVMPSYKLTYFDIRGLAENARILFAAAKQPYEDVRLSLSFGTPGDFSTIQRLCRDDPKGDFFKATICLDGG